MSRGIFTKGERAQVDRTHAHVKDHAFDTLLEFANFDRRNGQPWTELYDGIETWTIHGDPFETSAADELQAEVRGDLNKTIVGSFRLPSTDLAVACSTDAAGNVQITAPETDLADYLLWALLQLHVRNEARHLKRCDVCSQFVLGRSIKRTYCGRACQDRASNAAKAERLGREAERAKRNRVYGTSGNRRK